MSTTLSAVIQRANLDRDAVLRRLRAGEVLSDTELDGFKKLAEHSGLSINGLANGIEGLGELIAQVGSHAEIDSHTAERIGWLVSLLGSAIEELLSTYQDALHVIDTAEGQS